MASESSNANLTGLVDDDYFSALAHGRSDADADTDVTEDDELFPISDEKYAAELQLQEVIMSFAIAADTAQSSLPTRHIATNSSATPVVVTGQCSSAVASSSSSSSSLSNAAASTFDCKICLDAVPLSDALHASRGYIAEDDELFPISDDFYFSALAHGRSDADADVAEDDELFPISDEKYAAELQLQEVIMSSAIEADTAQSSLPTRHTATNSSATQVAVTGECSSAGASSSSSSSLSNVAASTFDCKICLDTVPLSDVLHASRGCVAEDDELFLISDENYAAELQLQEVIMSSAIAADTAQSSLPMRHTATNSSATPVVVTGECSSAGASSSSSSLSNTAANMFVFCKICLDAVPPSDALRASRGCSHTFCAACLTGYIGAKIQDRIADVKCPEEGCAGVLDPALCQGMLPREVFERWGAALCESMVLGAKRAYCPFKDCSAMMVVDDGDGADITESECPCCRRLFCAQCGVPWHSGADCAAYRKLGRGDKGKEDMMLQEMAKGKKWKRCPRCEFFVEKVDGCLHITCRCGFDFCYGCGKQWGVTHSICNTG